MRKKIVKFAEFQGKNTDLYSNQTKDRAITFADTIGASWMSEIEPYIAWSIENFHHDYEIIEPYQVVIIRENNGLYYGSAINNPDIGHFIARNVFSTEEEAGFEYIKRLSKDAYLANKKIKDFYEKRSVAKNS